MNGFRLLRRNAKIYQQISTKVGGLIRYPLFAKLETPTAAATPRRGGRATPLM